MADNSDIKLSESETGHLVKSLLCRLSIWCLVQETATVLSVGLLSNEQT